MVEPYLSDASLVSELANAQVLKVSTDMDINCPFGTGYTVVPSLDVK